MSTHWLHQMPPHVSSRSPLPHLLQALCALYPPQCVVHVGIGQGMGELVQWRQWTDLPRAVLIDADDTRLSWARQNTLSTWRVLHATVAQTDGPHPFYRASNPQEDGLLPPEQLKVWWPQLSALAAETRPAQTLDQIMAMADTEASPLPKQGTNQDSPNHWLLLDCLPAAQLLRGARALLAQTSVVCARTSQAPCDSTSPLADTGQLALIELLAPLGFVPLGQTDTHHPALGYTLLARQPTPQPTQAATNTPAQASTATAIDPPVTAQPLTAFSQHERAAPQPQTHALQAENEALRQRLELLQEELLRAEGQIDLIKDLMLRDQEL